MTGGKTFSVFSFDITDLDYLFIKLSGTLLVNFMSR